MKKQERKKLKEKAKNSKPLTRLQLPPNKRHKSKKDYKRKKIVYELIK